MRMASSRAQHGDAGGEREGELLARRSTRRMNASRVCDEIRSDVAPDAERQRDVEIGLHMRRPVGRERAVRGGGEGIEPERHGAVGRTRARPLDQRGEAQRLARAECPEVELEMRAGVEAHAFERRVQRRRIELPQSEAVGADRTGENDGEAVGAAGEIVERLGVGFACVGMIEAGHDPPGTRGAQRSGAVGRPHRAARWRFRQTSGRKGCRGSCLSGPLRRPCASRLRSRPERPPRPRPRPDLL